MLGNWAFNDRKLTVEIVNLLMIMTEQESKQQESVSESAKAKKEIARKEREARLQDALRANLRRRKVQTRGRADD